jgi:Fe-S-cluster containining protein
LNNKNTKAFCLAKFFFYLRHLFMKARTLITFKLRLRHKRQSFLKLLRRLDRKPPRGLQKIAVNAAAEVWDHVDCLSCANCCKVMTPTYTNADIKRIAAHLEMSEKDFKTQWLKKERGTGEWINKSTPCQFLDGKTNLCSIYDVRPADCAGFPHLTKKRVVDYLHVHIQNIDECPATFKMVERMEEMLGK